MLYTLFFLLLGAGHSETSERSGNMLYDVYCAGCHKEDGTGNGYCADFINDKTRLAKSDEELFLSIKNGKGGMPPYGWMLSDEDILNIIEYIRDTFGDQ